MAGKFAHFKTIIFFICSGRLGPNICTNFFSSKLHFHPKSLAVPCTDDDFCTSLFMLIFALLSSGPRGFSRYRSFIIIIQERKDLTRMLVSVVVLRDTLWEQC